MTPSPRAAKRAYSIAFSFGVALFFVAVLRDQAMSLWVLTLSVAALSVAIAGTQASRVPWGEAALEAVLLGLILAALPPIHGPWIAIAAVGMVSAAVFGALAARAGKRVAAAGLVLALVVGTIALGGFGLGDLRGLPQKSGDTDRQRMPIHAWSQVHYVIGTKYFEELRYFDLYSGMLLADREGANNFKNVRKVRDLHTYEVVSVQVALDGAREDGLRERFSDARWSQFQEDLETFHPYLRKRYWREMFGDLGYNPSPAWLVVHRPLLNAVDLHEGRTLEFFSLIQLLLHLATVAALWWGFSKRPTLWMVLWMLLFFGNRGRWIGGYFTYDWNALALIAAALYAKGRTGSAAPLVGYAGLMRGYVGLMAVGPALAFLEQLWTRARGWSRHPSTVFAASLAASMAFILAWTLLADGGPGAWVEWYDKISLHAERIQSGGNHLGLKTLFGEDYATAGLTLRPRARDLALAQQLTAYRVVALGLSVWTLAVIWRLRDRLDGFILGLFLTFFVLVLSRYYYSVFALFLMLGTTAARREPRLPVLIGMFGMLALFEASGVAGVPQQGMYQVANFSFLALCVLTLSVYTIKEWRHR